MNVSFFSNIKCLVKTDGNKFPNLSGEKKNKKKRNKMLVRLKEQTRSCEFS